MRRTPVSRVRNYGRCATSRRERIWGRRLGPWHTSLFSSVYLAGVAQVRRKGQGGLYMVKIRVLKGWRHGWADDIATRFRGFGGSVSLRRRQRCCEMGSPTCWCRCRLTMLWLVSKQSPSELASMLTYVSASMQRRGHSSKEYGGSRIIKIFEEWHPQRRKPPFISINATPSCVHAGLDH
ncbi:hypothetical protein LY76DRAFT_376282 [Colletotrichum caudatum]|nr:hypothetical protein LY76DRAFT_376282 [Colletotrichum caudatum]